MSSNQTRDRQPFRVYTRDPDSRLLIHDGLIYQGARVAEREVRKIKRVLGLAAEARPMADPQHSA